MENTLNQTPIPLNPQTSPLDPPVLQEKKNLSKPLLVFVLLVLISAIGGGAYYLGTQQSASQPVNILDDKKLPVPTSDILETASPTQTIVGLKTYTLPTINFQFELPERVSELGTLEEEIMPGEAGTQLCGQFEKETSFLLVPIAHAGGGCVTLRNDYITIGTTSVEYTAGREGMFTDLQGFVMEEGVYKGVYPTGKLMDFPQERVKKITNQHGVEILEIDGLEIEEEGPTLMNSLGDRRGVIINTKNSTYPGLAIIFEQETGLTADEVDLAIQSFRFIE